MTATLKQVQIHDTREDIDPFDEKLIDKFLEKMNFPTGVHVKGCHFMHCKLPPLKLSSRVALGNIACSIHCLIVSWHHIRYSSHKS